MDYVRLGSSGIRISRFGLGLMGFGDPEWRDWVLPESESEPIMRAAVEAGITFFDTADMYSIGASEEVTGRLLKSFFTRREDYVLASKVYMPVGEGPNDRGLSRGHIMDAIDASLRRLQVEHLDLYQIHRWDYATPIEETMEALNDIVRAGKVRYIGASSMYAWQFAKAQRAAAVADWTGFVAMQGHYNLIYREEEREMLPQCVDMGVGYLPFSPLARGVLARPRSEATGTTRAQSDTHQDWYYGDASVEVLDALEIVADEVGASRAQVAMAWLLRKEGVVAPIIGATKKSHIVDSVKALDIELDDHQVERLERGYRPRPVVGI